LNLFFPLLTVIQSKPITLTLTLTLTLTVTLILTLPQVNNYQDFFSRVNLSYTPEQFTKMLRNAVRNSVNKGYTTGIDLSSLGGQELEIIPEIIPKSIAEGIVESIRGSDPESVPESLPESLLENIGSKVSDYKWEDVRVGDKGEYSEEKIMELKGLVSLNMREYKRQSDLVQAERRRSNSISSNSSRGSARGSVRGSAKGGDMQYSQRSNGQLVSSSVSSSVSGSVNGSSGSSGGSGSGFTTNSSNSTNTITTTTGRVTYTRPAAITPFSHQRKSNPPILQPSSTSFTHISRNKGKINHKNSKLNNAMTVSGDKVRLHVFYQGKFVAIGGQAPTPPVGDAAKIR
jgi:hypothetical protein